MIQQDVAESPDATESSPVSNPVPRARRLPWAALLKRIFGLEILRCPRCGGRRKVMAFVTDPKELARICAHLYLPTAPPSVHPARSPPQAEIPFPDGP